MTSQQPEMSSASGPVTLAEPSHPLAQATTPRESTEEGKQESIAPPPVPMVHLRVLVISGQSHVFTFEPEITVGRMKELVWSNWPSEWHEPAAPPAPSFLRILHAGRILQDDSTLSSNNLPAALPPTTPTVVHISVRSFSIRAEDDGKTGSKLGMSRTRSRAREEEVGGCKCIIM